MLPNCPCGGEVYTDWWYNYRTKQLEVFMRCPECSKYGPVGKTEEEAEELWRNSQSSAQ